MIFLHGGWGYQIYPFQRQITALRDRCRILIPDRTGYGRSPRAKSFPLDFHRRAMEETLRFMDTLGIDRPILWGHSDGAVISALFGMTYPERVTAVILEAFHYERVKLGSRTFFETMARDPAKFGERVTNVLKNEHGPRYWKTLLMMEGQVWLDLALKKKGPPDLYEGKLSQLSVPTLFLHGSRDQRTEPGEMDSVRRELPSAVIRMIRGAGHSPHNEAPDACIRFAKKFIDGLEPDVRRGRRR